MVGDASESEVREEYERYVQWWSTALAELLLWSDTEVTEWIRDRRAQAESLFSMGIVLHREPAYWIVDELIPDSLCEEVAAEANDSYAQIAQRLQDAIEGNQDLSFYYSAETDWAACRDRVNAVLGEFGYSLPSPDN